MDRRTFVRTAGATFAVASVGCLDRFGTESEARLSTVNVVNKDAERRTIEVRVFRGSEVVHRSSHELGGRDGGDFEGSLLECTWNDDPGVFVVEARVDGGDWVERLLTEDVDVDCVQAGVEVHEGEIVIARRLGCSPTGTGGCFPVDE